MKYWGGVLLVFCAISVKAESVFAAATASISSTSTVNLSATPSASGTIARSSATVTVGVTGASTYSLYLNTSSTNLSGSDESITTISSNSTPNNFAANRWGYCFSTSACSNTSTFSPISTSQITLQTKNLMNTTDQYAANDTFYLTYAAKVNNTLRDGAYTNTQTISLVANDYNITAPSLTVDNINEVSIRAAGAASDGVSHYEYYTSSSSSTPSSSATASGTTSSSLTVSSTDNRYVWYRTVSNSGGKSSWSSRKVVNGVWEYSYTGGQQTLSLPETGRYKLEVWGAQGGSTNSAGSTVGTGGYGGYSVGTYSTTTTRTLYIYVGGQGQAFNGAVATTSGYNGTGGGATHIATSSGQLSSLSSNQSAVLIVAGGGGAGATYKSKKIPGGHAGGYQASKIQRVVCANAGCTSGSGPSTTQNSGGTQTASGIHGTSGAGTYYAATSMTAGSFGQAARAGGGGWYGGAYFGGSNHLYGGAGGSGYIGNSSLSNKAMYAYKASFTSSTASTLTYSTDNVSSTATSNYAKSGNGYVRITFIGN